MTQASSLLTVAAGAARHAANRQTVIARNIANADTPGFVAQDLAPFAQQAQGDPPEFAPRQTRAGHISSASTGLARSGTVDSFAPGAASPDGNTVSIEDQMVRAADARRQYDLALTLYRKSLDMMRLGLGRAR